MASYGSERSFLLIFYARDDLVKVSWKSNAGKCQNQVTPPYFDQLSESSQPLLPSLISYWEQMIYTLHLCQSLVGRPKDSKVSVTGFKGTKGKTKRILAAIVKSSHHSDQIKVAPTTAGLLPMFDDRVKPGLLSADCLHLSRWWWWYIYYDEVSVCLSVTKNEHFLLGVSCDHLNYP